jgi:hypothetical protein
MENGYRILWTDNALIELKQTIDYLEQNWSAKEINKLAVEIPLSDPISGQLNKTLKMKRIYFIFLMFLSFFSCINSNDSKLDLNDDPSKTSVKIDSLVSVNNNNSKTGPSKISNCNFKFTFDLNEHDEIEKCSFSFLVLDGMKFDDLYYTKNDYTVKIVANLEYDENWIEKEFPILWIQKKINGQESFQGVNNLYVQFENIYFKDNIKLKIEEMCEIENSVIAKILPNQKIQCFDYIPEDFSTWKLHINLKNITEKPNR